MKHSKTFIENELNEIFKLVVAGKQDREIIQARNLPRRSYQIYRDKLQDRIAEAHMQQKTELVLFHKEVTKERILHDKAVFAEVMDDPTTRPHTRVEAARADLEANVVLFKLENETAMFVKTFRQQQSDVLRFDAIATRVISEPEQQQDQSTPATS